MVIGVQTSTSWIRSLGDLAYIMVCEYYLLIFARSPTTLRYLPRFLAFNFFVFVQYTFNVPYGFTSLAAMIMWASSLFWMFWFVLECEIKALRRGIVSIETPRAFYTLLSSPQWPISLPPHWSIFHELNRVHRSIYDEDLTQNDVETGQQPFHHVNNNHRRRVGNREAVVLSTNNAHRHDQLPHRRNRRSESSTSSNNQASSSVTVLNSGNESTI